MSKSFADDHHSAMEFVNNQTVTDNVNHPEHYNQYGIECIQAIKASMSHLEFCGYLKGNAMKYLWRYRYKGKQKEDLEKSQWYLSLLIEEIEEAEDVNAS